MKTTITTALCGALLALVPAVADAAAPGASTGGVRDLTSTSATLVGRVDPNARPTSYFFEYGTTTGYGSRTPNTDAGSGNGPREVTAPVSGLKPRTTYHYRLVAFSTDGTTRGGDRTFKTQPVPVTVTLNATPNPVLFGQPVSLTGNVGGRPAGTQVVLQRNAFPFTAGFADASNPQTTDAAGAFAFPVLDVGSTTQFRVRTTDKEPAFSPIVTEQVAVSVTARARVKRFRHHADVRVSGTVRPRKDAAPLAIQKLKDGRWVTVKGGITRRASEASSGFSVKMRIRRGGFYRVFVRVVDGANTSGESARIRVRAKR